MTTYPIHTLDTAVAFHSTMALAEGVDPRHVDAVRRGGSPDDLRLGALSTLTRTLIDTRGHLDDADAEAFTGAGFDDHQLLEVITGVAISTMANYTGNITRAPLEKPFQAQAWTAGQ